jgi:hypothetical protein
MLWNWNQYVILNFKICLNLLNYIWQGFHEFDVLMLFNWCVYKDFGKQNSNTVESIRVIYLYHSMYPNHQDVMAMPGSGDNNRL